MESTLNGSSSSIGAVEEGADDSEKPPPWEASDLMHIDDPALRKEMQYYLENEESAMISREEIESSLKIINWRGH